MLPTFKVVKNLFFSDQKIWQEADKVVVAFRMTIWRWMVWESVKFDRWTRQAARENEEQNRSSRISATSITQHKNIRVRHYVLRKLPLAVSELRLLTQRRSCPSLKLRFKKGEDSKRVRVGISSVLGKITSSFWESWMKVQKSLKMAKRSIFEANS